MLLRLLCLFVAAIHVARSQTVQPNIETLHITSDIKDRYATTLISARVKNPTSQDGDAVFNFTIPDSAFISGFVMEIKSKVYESYVKEKLNQNLQAQSGQVARDSNLVTVTINIEANGDLTFKLTYEQLLPRKLGFYSNVINIDPKQIVEDMWIKVNIEESTEIKHLEVPEVQEPNHRVDSYIRENTLAKIQMISRNHKIVTWAPTPEEQKSHHTTGVSGQLIVKYDVDRTESPQQIAGDNCYFIHFFAPEHLPKLKKHVVFVLDFSGSMDGRKIEQLKDAMKRIISDLEPRDYFSVVIFHSTIHVWSPRNAFATSGNSASSDEFVVEASPANIYTALHHLTTYSDNGATNIMGALRTGLQLVDIGQQKLQAVPPQPMVIFLTDGLPNEEVSDTTEIIDKIKALNTKEAPIFSLAFGYDADFDFLRKLSLSNQGFAQLIYEAADASAQLKNFYQSVASPLLSNVTFNYLPGQVTSSTKRVFAIYFLGSEIIVAGKFADDATTTGNTTIGELSGVSADGLLKYNITIDKNNGQKQNCVGHLKKMWVFLTIKQLLDKAASLGDGDEKTEIKAKALELALQYSLVTPLTSLVILQPNGKESVVDAVKLKPGDNNNTSIAVPNVYKVVLSDIKWLQSLLISQIFTVDVQGKNYHLGLSEADTTFGDCTVQSEAGECRHIKYCALNVFADDISKFTPYQCPITGDYLGVCCPINVQ